MWVACVALSCCAPATAGATTAGATTAGAVTTDTVLLREVSAARDAGAGCDPGAGSGGGSTGRTGTTGNAKSGGGSKDEYRNAPGCVDELPVAGGYTVAVKRNFPLTGSPTVTHALIVVHGTGRNMEHTYAGMVQAATHAGAIGQTLVAAPFFKADGDEPGSREARWSSDGWKEGADAEQPKGLSSFQVVDVMMAMLADRARFPRLTRVTLVGHSAGGQFTQRYAATGQAPFGMPGVAVDYVVANPSSYMYLSPDRPDLSDPSGARFLRPTVSCDYNAYKYGLEGRPGYLNRLTEQQIVATYTGRRVTYLLGGSDTDKDEDLDTDCAAMVQGRNRFQRGTRFFDWVRSRFPQAPHTRVVVPGIGHDHDRLFDSAQARPVLFGPGSS
ncbi:MAG TPA: hypothetical protein VGH99_00115 [Pseudonocardia sp.]